MTLIKKATHLGEMNNINNMEKLILKLIYSGYRVEIESPHNSIIFTIYKNNQRIRHEIVKETLENIEPSMKEAIYDQVLSQILRLLP